MNRIFLLIIISFSLNSCALSKAIYLGSGFSQNINMPFSNERYNAENINGVFPEEVFIKTRTQTFNTYHYYILYENRIWYKNINPQAEPVNWTLFAETGLPYNVRSIVEISADADELMAVCEEGRIYTYRFDMTITLKANSWIDKHGWPTAEQLFFDDRTSRNLSWAIGRRNAHVQYYDDVFGNQHNWGISGISTIYILLDDGQEICYGDSGLPCDFSRNLIGPERGAFKAVSLSASASTMFVINEAGEMYTRLADFDTAGFNPMMFQYTYTPYKSDLTGDNIFSIFNEWGLPGEDWRYQPRIPLERKAAITGYITILQNGHGNSARELRVAGLNEDGETGYWRKQIYDIVWEFVTAPLYFDEDAILINADNYKSEVKGERGQSLDKSYSGFWWNGNEKENELEYQIPNFNILEGDCYLIITRQAESCTLKLHPLEMWTYHKRDYFPGRTGSPKIFLVTLEIPENAFESISNEFKNILMAKFGMYHHKLFHFIIAAANSYIIFREFNENNSLMFLTDGTISTHYSQFHAGSYMENFNEVKRYYSQEMMINDNTALTFELLTEKIAVNKQFEKELKYKIRELKWSQLTAFKFNASYITAHYIANITLLRFFINPIRTVTAFGDKLIFANNAYTYITTNSRINVYEKIIEMLETRILCYNDILKTVSSGNSTEINELTIPVWYSDNITDYWNIAGLPNTIEGIFYAPQSVQIKASLTFIAPQSDKNVSGWLFAIGNSSNFSIFMESHNSAKTIYSRRGLSPQERRLQFDCKLYINNSANNAVEQDIIERCLRPFISGSASAASRGTSESINVRITFDGRILEIREYPARRANPIIFRGIL
jgi:hypothetical protein